MDSFDETCWGQLPDLGEVGAEVVYCFGLPGEAEIESRDLVFLCHDASQLRRWLGQPFAAKVLQSETSRLCLFNPQDSNDALFQWLFSAYAGRTVAVVGTDWARERYPEILEALQQRLVGESALASRSLSEFLQFGDAFYQNFYKNLRQLDGAILGSSLFGSFKGVPAVICGAGPSLDRQREAIRAAGERGLLLTGGSALNALCAAGRMPHFAVGIDPYYPQYQRLMTCSAFTVPMFFQLRWFAQALELWDGPHVYLNGSPVYPIVAALEERLGIAAEPLQTGHNVVNLSLDLARALGCDPIILIGVDLCYQGLQHYAEGVLTDASDRLPERGHPYDLPILREDSEGRTVHTHWKWLAERDYISEYATKHPDLTLINATEGGLPIPGLPHMSLEDVVEAHLQKPRPMRSLVHAALATAPLVSAPPAKIDRFCREIETSLLVCREKLEALNGELRAGLQALYEVELSEEMAYRLILEPLEQAHRAAGREDSNNFLQTAIDRQLHYLRERV